MEKMKPVEIQFINENLQKAYKQLDDPTLKKFIDRALEDIEKNPFCGIQISKRLIPQEYIKKHNIKNVWKYNLPEAWRLIYSIEGGTLKIVTIVLEWMDHKEYERRFNY
jgi:mRNA-degrading endonuclease RelE of RelBE toxin-antitoxin system